MLLSLVVGPRAVGTHVFVPSVAVRIYWTRHTNSTQAKLRIVPSVHASTVHHRPTFSDRVHAVVGTVEPGIVEAPVVDCALDTGK